jgi:hypothetical protein
MSEIDDGGCAFPESASGPYPNGEIVLGRSGMSLRDYFAAAALQGCLAYSHVKPQWGNYQEYCSTEAVAEMAYKYADAMIAARKEVQP